MKEYGCCPKFKRGDNSTYTFTKRGRDMYLECTTPTRLRYRNVVDVRNPRRMDNIKVRKTKSYNMWNEIWDKVVDMYFQ
jgi:hypothetical protein